MPVSCASESHLPVEVWCSASMHEVVSKSSHKDRSHEESVEWVIFRL